MRRRFLNNILNSISSDINYHLEYFTIEALEDGLTVKLSQNASQYRIDDGDWESLAADTVTPISINTGQKIYFKINSPTITDNYGIGTFTISKQYNVSGNIMSLLYGDDFIDKVDLTNKGYAFFELFKNSPVVSAKNLILPATTLERYCYTSMFQSCSELTIAPALPAMEMVMRCYNNMFNNCISLTKAPELPATTLDSNCYSYMFSGCINLNTVPSILPATTLASQCYYQMFRDCESLTKAPELPATKVTMRSYYYMFSGCTSLAIAPELPATTLATYCYYSMFRNCTSLTKAPELPATTLATSCYYQMFYGCSNLSYIRMLATDISARSCLTGWVDGVASTGTFVKRPDMNDLSTGVDGIPSGWTVIDEEENGDSGA